MLKASRVVPGGTSDSANAGGLDEQRPTPVHEKLSDIAIASERATSTAMIVVRTTVTVATRRYGLNETSHLHRLNNPPTGRGCPAPAPVAAPGVGAGLRNQRERKSRMAAAISATRVSSAKCPVS